KKTAHDIRSPLSAWAMIAQGSSNLDDSEKLLLKQVADRINSIANDILNMGRDSETTDENEKFGAHSLDRLVRNVVKEKQLHLPDAKKIFFNFLEITSNDSAFCDYSETQRIVSNILNNAVEAISNEG